MKSITYYFKLKIVSPVHLGCDEVYEPTGFAIDEQAGELVSFDPAAFLGRLAQQELDKYAAICRKGTVASLLEIYKFIRQHKEHAKGRRVAVSDAFVAHYTKTLNLPPDAVKQQLNKFLVGRTAFQRVDSIPYIPGSAIKGAIRTAVLNLRNNGSGYPKYRNGKELDNRLAGGIFATDPFRLIKVGDFQALGETRQRIVYAVNRKKKLSKKEARGPYQMLEVIETGSEFIGTITVQQAPDTRDHSVKIKQPVQIEEIHRALSGFYNQEQEKEKTVLSGIGCDVSGFEKFPGGTTLIRIGRHSGAECVTVGGQRVIKIMQGSGPKTKSKDHATTIWLAAGSDNPRSNRLLQPFGWAVLSLMTEKEALDSEQKKRVDFNTWETEQQLAIKAFKENAKLMARQREAEIREQDRLAREQKKKEEEMRQYPWRKFLSTVLAKVENWGDLKIKVLEQDDFKKYQMEQEVGLAVEETSIRVAKVNRKKWDKDRDQIVAEWLAVSKVDWQPMVKVSVVPVPQQDNAVLLDRINNLQNWREFRSAGIKTVRLDRQCAAALRDKFMKWKLKKSKDEQQKKAFKAVNTRLQKLS